MMMIRKLARCRQPCLRRSLMSKLHVARRRSFMSKPWYVPDSVEVEESKGVTPITLYSNLKPWRTRVTAAFTTGNFFFFAWFMEATNTPGHFIEEIPYCGFLGFFGVAGSAVMLAANMRARTNNIVMIKLHEDQQILEFFWHTILGGTVSKLCPTYALKISAYTPQNRDSEMIFFQVPFQKASKSVKLKSTYTCYVWL
eukprot:jgi/Bigna1/89757/estExt_fgenesh1_pg.C_550025